MSDTSLLRTGQVALILGVNPKTVDRWGKDDLLGPLHPVGKQTRYERAAVLAFAAKRDHDREEHDRLVAARRTELISEADAQSPRDSSPEELIHSQIPAHAGAAS
jgi:hypothetical protein